MRDKAKICDLILGPVQLWHDGYLRSSDKDLLLTVAKPLDDVPT